MIIYILVDYFHSMVDKYIKFNIILFIKIKQFVKIKLITVKNKYFKKIVNCMFTNCWLNYMFYNIVLLTHLPKQIKLINYS